jgi:hypothetical protein
MTFDVSTVTGPLTDAWMIMKEQAQRLPDEYDDLSLELIAMIAKVQGFNRRLDGRSAYLKEQAAKQS